MQTLNPTQNPLPQSQADDLASFFKSETCAHLRTLALSRILEHTTAAGNVVIENAEGFMRAGVVNEQASESISQIARYSIFLKVLEELNAQAEKESVVISKSITIDPN